MKFEEIILRITSGEDVPQEEFIKYLIVDSKEARKDVCFKLASAYFESKQYEKAKVFVEKSWLLSGFSEEVISLYVRVCEQFNDVTAIKNAYKRIGINYAKEGNITCAIKYFNRWHYAEVKYNNSDEFEYDFDILDAMRTLALPYRVENSIRPVDGRKIKLGYLVFGMTHLNSIIVKILQEFSKYHDKDVFEPIFIIPEPMFVLEEHKQAIECIEKIQNNGCKVVIAPDDEDYAESLLGLVSAIQKENLDILVTSVGLGDFRHNFITNVRPAGAVIGMLMANHSQYISLDMDYSIAWSKQLLIDCPIDSSVVDLRVEVKDKSSINPVGFEKLGIKPNSKIIVSAGRDVKFCNPDFWHVVNEVLLSQENAYLVIVGADKKVLEYSQSSMSEKVFARLKFVGWVDNYLDVLSLADVVLDTFPAGGGVTLMDAMSLGIPCVGMRNNYMKVFNHNEWSLAEDYVGISDLIAPYNDFEKMKDIVIHLLQDEKFSKKMGKECEEQFFANRANPAIYVKEFEQKYIEFLNKAL